MYRGVLINKPNDKVNPANHHQSHSSILFLTNYKKGETCISIFIFIVLYIWKRKTQRYIIIEYGKTKRYARQELYAERPAAYTGADDNGQER